MFCNLIERCNSAIKYVNDSVCGVGETIKSGFDSVGRKVNDLTSFLPQELRDGIRDTYTSLPYAIPLCGFIPPGLGILAAGVAVVAVNYFEDRIGRERAIEYNHAIRTFCAIGATVDIARAAMSGNPILLLSVPFYVLFGMMAHKNAERLKAQTPVTV